MAFLRGLFSPRVPVEGSPEPNIQLASAETRGVTRNFISWIRKSVRALVGHESQQPTLQSGPEIAMPESSDSKHLEQYHSQTGQQHNTPASCQWGSNSNCGKQMNWGTMGKHIVDQHF
ncbi:hypothetical protein A0H81_14464 [Grifola frondosa]|uniref:Uncharacterized protein n=1 Tax=Grifola frondosa TaxID=5627 RepID=A0A1C7LNH3_GRIFR|nr:hypothetical protein A0H81_14464 [Grifola frondosa]